MSQIYPQLQQFSRDQNGRPMCIYGDPTYSHQPQFRSPFKCNNLTPLQKQYSKAVSQVQASVEWAFGDSELFCIRGLNPLTTKCSQSYRNQSTDLHCKSIHWFLYDGEHWSLMGYEKFKSRTECCG